MKNQYYAHGKFFDSMDEFLQFCQEWGDMPFDLEEFKRQMQNRIVEADTNNQVRGGTLTNREAYKILRLSTDWALDRCHIEEVK